MRIYVGNLSYQTSEDELRQTFEEYGQVESTNIIMDKFTNRSRGFGFVDMPADGEAKAAIEALDGYSLDGRPLRVNEARPREERAPYQR